MVLGLGVLPFIAWPSVVGAFTAGYNAAFGTPSQAQNASHANVRHDDSERSTLPEIRKEVRQAVDSEKQHSDAQGQTHLTDLRLKQEEERRRRAAELVEKRRLEEDERQRRLADVKMREAEERKHIAEVRRSEQEARERELAEQKFRQEEQQRKLRERKRIEEDERRKKMEAQRMQEEEDQRKQRERERLAKEERERRLAEARMREEEQRARREAERRMKLEDEQAQLERQIEDERKRRLIVEDERKRLEEVQRREYEVQGRRRAEEDRIHRAEELQTASKAADEKRRLLERAFDKIDADRNGAIDVVELSSFGQLLGMHQSLADYRRVFAKMDKDEDSRVTRSEFIAFFASKDIDAESILHSLTKMSAGRITAEQRHQIEATFRVVDRDNSGYIDANEMYVLGVAFNPFYTRSKCNQFFAKLDTDGDGLINLDEFIAFCSTLSEGVQPDRIDRQLVAMKTKSERVVRPLR